MRPTAFHALIRSILSLGAVLMSAPVEAGVRSTHVLLNWEDLSRAPQLRAQSVTPGEIGVTLRVVEAPFSFTAVAALTNPGSDGELIVRVSADGRDWSAPTVVPDDDPIAPFDERGQGQGQRFAFDRASSLYFPDPRKGPRRFLAFEFRGALNPPSRVAFHFIDAGPSPDRPARTRTETDDLPVHLLKPALVTREAWGARPPRYPYTLTLAGHLAYHHTAGVGDGLATTSEECAAQVRSIQAFHQDSRGWNDVGYSYLICGTGEVFQAREDNDDSTDVWGAHDGFNRGSMSVSLMGYFHPPYNQIPSPEMMASLVRTLAWMSDIRGLDPLEASLYEAFGSVRSHIYGHREVRATDCPGDTLFALKDLVRAEVALLLARFREGLVETTSRSIH